jgi:hypothetical protein
MSSRFLDFHLDGLSNRVFAPSQEFFPREDVSQAVVAKAMYYSTGGRKWFKYMEGGSKHPRSFVTWLMSRDLQLQSSITHAANVPQSKLPQTPSLREYWYIRDILFLRMALLQHLWAITNSGITTRVSMRTVSKEYCGGAPKGLLNSVDFGGFQLVLHVTGMGV